LRRGGEGRSFKARREIERREGSVAGRSPSERDSGRLSTHPENQGCASKEVRDRGGKGNVHAE